MRAEPNTPLNADRRRAIKAEEHAQHIVGINGTSYAQGAENHLNSIELANSKPGDQEVPAGFFAETPHFEDLLGVFEPFQHDNEYVTLTEKINGLRKKEDKEHARRLWNMLNTSRQQEALLKYEQQVPISVKPEVVSTLTEISAGANGLSEDEKVMMQKALRGEYKEVVKQAEGSDYLLVLHKLDGMPYRDQVRLVEYLEMSLSKLPPGSMEYKQSFEKLRSIAWGDEKRFLDIDLNKSARMAYSEEEQRRINTATDAKITSEHEAGGSFATARRRNPDTMSARTVPPKRNYAQSPKPSGLARAWDSVKSFFSRR
jgi:hypothetical protein